MVAGVMSDDPARQLEATTQFRKLLSIGASPRLHPLLKRLSRDRLPLTERNPPIDEVIAKNVIPYFVTFLRRDENPQLQVRAQHVFLCTTSVHHTTWCTHTV